MLANTILIAPERRLTLFQSGESGIAASKDPFIVLARVIDPLDRNMTKLVQSLASRESAATELDAKALLATYGNSVAPDATFSLRISDGQPKRYPMNGTFAPPFTTFYGLYDRSIGFASTGPWVLPQRWQDRKDSLALATPYNVASTNDIIGGNSGQPGHQQGCGSGGAHLRWQHRGTAEPLPLHRVPGARCVPRFTRHRRGAAEHLRREVDRR